MSTSRLVLFAHAAMLSVALIYSFNYFISKDVFVHISANAVLALRSLSAGVCFSLLTLLFYRRVRVEKQDIGRFIYCGITGITLNQLCFLWGLEATSEINSAILMITSPIFVYLIAYFLGQEGMNWRTAIGILLSFAGCVWLILGDGKGFSLGGATTKGDILIIINAICYSMYLVGVKPLVAKYPPIFLFAVLFWIGGTINVLVSWQDFALIPWGELPTDILWKMGYIGLFTTILAYLLNVWAMKYVPASYVGVYVYLQPILVSLLTWFNPEKQTTFTLTKVLSMLLVFVGLGLVTLWKERKA